MSILDDTKRKGIEFRKAFASDALAIDQLRHEAIEATVNHSPLKDLVDFRQAYDWHQKDSQDRIRVFILDAKKYVEVAVDAATDQIVGYSITTGNELERMFVAPSHHGNGIGGQLLARVEERVREYQTQRGLPPIVKVDSFVTSRPFYAKHGYTATFARKFELDTSTIFTYWMLKHLDGEPIRGELVELSDARGEIDKIDHEIITLITHRFAVTQWVGELKANHAKDAYDGSREENQRDVISEWADMYGMPDWLMQTIFGILREETRKNHREIRNSAHFNKAAVDPGSEQKDDS